MKKNRLIHKWVGLSTLIFILIVSFSAILLNHKDLLYKNKTEDSFSIASAKILTSDPFNKEHLVASDMKKLYHSTDLGKTWDELKLFVPAEKVNNIVFDPSIKDKFWVSLKEAGVYVTDDLGEVWDELSLPFAPNEGEYIENLSVNSNNLFIKTKFAFYNYDQESEKWSTQKFDLNKEQVLNTHELIYNLHTGKFFGEYGIYLYDLVSLGLILLSISGIKISFRPKAKVNKRLELTVKTQDVKVPTN